MPRFPIKQGPCRAHQLFAIVGPQSERFNLISLVSETQAAPQLLSHRPGTVSPWSVLPLELFLTMLEAGELQQGSFANSFATNKRSAGFLGAQLGTVPLPAWHWSPPSPALVPSQLGNDGIHRFVGDSSSWLCHVDFCLLPDLDNYTLTREIGIQDSTPSSSL